MAESLEFDRVFEEFDEIESSTNLTVVQLQTHFEKCIDAVLRGKVFKVTSREGFSAVLERGSLEAVEAFQKESREAFVNHLPELLRQMKESGPIQIEGESSNVVFRLLETRIDYAEGGRLLRELRIKSGLSQRELSRKTGLSAAVISNLETAKGRRPRMGTLKKLFSAFKVSRQEQAPIFMAYGLEMPSYTLLNPPELQPIDELELQGDEKVDEIWVAGEPMECTSVELEEKVADLIRKGKEYVYWVPIRILPKMLRFINRLGSVYEIDVEQVKQQVKLIRTPDELGVIPCALYFQKSEIEPLVGRYVRNKMVCSLDHVEVNELNDLLQSVYFGMYYGEQDPRYDQVFPTCVL